MKHQNKEFIELFEKSGLTQDKFCNIFTIKKRTLRSWIYGERQCPESYISILNIFIENPDVIKGK